MKDYTVRVDDLQTTPIHLNGSGRDNLVNDWAEAISAIDLAEDKLRRCAPHMRDFYHVMGSDATYNLALEQHTDRLIRLHSIKEELNSLINAACQPQWTGSKVK